MPVGFQNSASGLELVFCAAGSYSLMRPPRTARRLAFSWGEVCYGVVGPGRVELAAAARSPSVVVLGMLRHD